MDCGVEVITSYLQIRVGHVVLLVGLERPHSIRTHPRLSLVILEAVGLGIKARKRGLDLIVILNHPGYLNAIVPRQQKSRSNLRLTKV